MDINDEEFMRSLLDQLENTSWDQYMNLCYNVLMMFPAEVLEYDDKKTTHKIKSLNRILLYFEEKEDFEKCDNIKDLQDRLKNC